MGAERGIRLSALLRATAVLRAANEASHKLRQPCPCGAGHELCAACARHYGYQRALRDVEGYAKGGH